MKFRLNDLFSKKILIQVYFVFFIFLNVIDFLNIISSDLDFFKKILSWLIIGYIFYKVSLSRVFIGKRLKSYDLGLVLIFCFFTIPKALVLYVSNIKVEGLIPSSYFFFGPFLRYVNSVDEHVFLTITFLFGFVFALVLSISLLLNHGFERKSFIGSFNFKEGYFKYFYEQVILSVFLLFFGIIIFNFFMEWFALAVDSIILVVGLVYYLFLYIHNHGKGKFSSVLKNVSNAGNNFYLSMIGMFSDRKTIFIGISFLLTLHLLVDIGVYLVPYAVGTENTLYFDSLNYYNEDTGVLREHKPLFSFMNFENSQLAADLLNSKGIDSFLILGVVLVYLVSFLGLFALMFLPFYIFYRNSQDEKVKFKSWIAIAVIASLVFIFFFKLFSYYDVFNSDISLPIDFDKPLSSKVNGVDIHTSTIFSSEISTSSVFVQFMVSILIFITAIAFLLFRYEKYKFFFGKLILIVVLLFFIYYIFLFYVSSVEAEADTLKRQFDLGRGDFVSDEKYLMAKSIYDDGNLFVFPGSMLFENDGKTFRANVYAFSDLRSMAGRTAMYSEMHNDYLLFDVEYDDDVKLKFYDYPRAYFAEGTYDFSSMRFVSENPDFIYYLGENYFSLKEVSENEYIVDLNIKEDTIDGFLYFPGMFSNSVDSMFRWIEYLRLVFISVFYVFGTFAFVYYYSKKNILN